MKKLTIKIDKGLSHFALALNETMSSAIKILEMAIDRYAPKEIDHECNAGCSLYEVLYQSEADLKGMVKHFPPEAWAYLNKLTLWGANGDCPYCGCQMELWDCDSEDNQEIFKCTNCEKTERR